MTSSTLGLRAALLLVAVSACQSRGPEGTRPAGLIMGATGGAAASTASGGAAGVTTGTGGTAGAGVDVAGPSASDLPVSLDGSEGSADGPPNAIDLPPLDATNDVVTNDVVTRVCDQTHAGEPAPLDLVLLVDRWTGMRSDWPIITAALKQFIGDPASAGISVGLQFFPALSCNSDLDCGQPQRPGIEDRNLDCRPTEVCFEANGRPSALFSGCDSRDEARGCPSPQRCRRLGHCADSLQPCALGGPACPGGQTCVPTGKACHRYLSYAGACVAPPYTGLAADLQLLPAGARSLSRTIDVTYRALERSKPTLFALRGTLDRLRQHAQQHPQRRVALVLVTDPYDESFCLGSQPRPAVVAADVAAITAARTQSPPIFTHVVGLTSYVNTLTMPTLEQFAQAGGTAPPLTVSRRAEGFAISLQAALAQVRTAALARPICVSPR